MIQTGAWQKHTQSQRQPMESTGRVRGGRAGRGTGHREAWKGVVCPTLASVKRGRICHNFLWKQSGGTAKIRPMLPTLSSGDILQNVPMETRGASSVRTECSARRAQGTKDGHREQPTSSLNKLDTARTVAPLKHTLAETV